MECLDGVIGKMGKGGAKVGVVGLKPMMDTRAWKVGVNSKEEGWNYEMHE